MALAHDLIRTLSALVVLAGLSRTHAADAATATAFDGTTLTGESVVVADGSVKIGGASLALADCDWIETGARAQGSGRADVWVRLVDGSSLPASRLAASDAPDAILLEDGPLGDLRLPLTALVGWGDDPRGDTTKDRVVLESGTLVGSVLGVTDGSLRFQSRLDPKPLAFPLGDVQALALATPVRPPKGIVLSVDLDPAHPPLYVLPKVGFPLASAPSVATGPALAGYRMRVEGGRRIYLGALKIARIEEIGAFGVVWKHRIDASIDGGPMLMGGVRYAHGITVHSKALVAWDLGGAYERLSAYAGISDSVAPEGDCHASLIGDGKVLWTRESVKGSDKPLPVSIDVRGVKSLELHVDYGARYDIGDHFMLADAWLLKVK
ncbi:MAG: NPCBM/NEW2 domain-containing protein [Planctomycetes bacterium]|nr:NPCBM/NEW2 domain-containing protein [Planctomycetota bacterium]